MAASILTRAADIAWKVRKSVSAVSVVLFTDGDAFPADVTALPNISAGTGAPTEAANDGSLYLRTNGTTGDNSLYMRIGGAWVALAGATP